MERTFRACATYFVIVALAALSAACATATKVAVPDNSKEIAEENAVSTLGEHSAIFWASIRAKANATANRVAEGYNLVCQDGLENTARCFKFMARLTMDTHLREALKTAKVLEVSVQASDGFTYGTGWVTVNTDAPTQEILDFLLGKKDQNQ